jgi:hypothetical protein
MHSLFIIAAVVKDWFNQQAEALGNNGIAVASLALSAAGNEPGEYGWCAVQLSAEKEQAVADLLAANPDKSALIDWTKYDLAAQPNWPQQRLAERGLKVIQKPFP